MHTGDTWRLGYVPALDGIRALAVILVVGYHLDWLLPGGYLGVDLFFALSGFLITSLLLTEHDDAGHIDLGAFWTRRGARLMPALAALVAVTLLVQRDARGAALAVTYTANLAAAAGTDLGLLGHTWSLALEEQFYLLWPLALVVCLRQVPHRLRAAVALAAMAAGLYVWTGHLFLAVGASAYFRPESRSATLLLGCALAFMASVPRARDVVMRRSLPAGVIGLFLLGVLAWALSPPSLSSPTANAVVFPVAGLASATLVASLAVADNPLSRLASTPVLVWTGQVSYSVYLWHYLVLHLTAGQWLPLRLCLVVAAAAASYYLVERPVRRLCRRRADSAAPLAS